MNIQLVPQISGSNTQVVSMLHRQAQMELLQQAASVAVEERITKLKGDVESLKAKYAEVKNEDARTEGIIQKHLDASQQCIEKDGRLVIKSHNLQVISEHEFMSEDGIDAVNLARHNCRNPGSTHIWWGGIVGHKEGKLSNGVDLVIRAGLVPVYFQKRSSTYDLLRLEGDTELVALLVRYADLHDKCVALNLECNAVDAKLKKVQAGASTVHTSMLRANLESSTEGASLLDAARKSLAGIL